jgi:hypothetical protein
MTGLDEGMLRKFAALVAAGDGPEAAIARLKPKRKGLDLNALAAELMERDDVQAMIRHEERGRMARGEPIVAEAHIPSFEPTEEGLVEGYRWIATAGAQRRSLNDVKQALDSIAKMKGMFTETRKHQHSGETTIVIKGPEADL